MAAEDVKAALAMTYDPNQRFISLVPGGNGIIYGVQADGALVRYQHTGWADGRSTWASVGGQVIGTDWHQFTTVVAAADGTFFALRPNGDLLCFQYANGSWVPWSGAKIGTGFDRFGRVFGGWDGVIYGVDPNGNLFWYRYAGNSGSAVWGAGSGKQIGAGFNQFPWLFADPGGVIYGVRQGGDLAWWRYGLTNARTGAGAWARGGNRRTIGTGWGPDLQKTAFSNTSGVLYALALDTGKVPGTDSQLQWFRLKNPTQLDTSGAIWLHASRPINVGSGFTLQSSAALHGYAGQLHTTPGGKMPIQVSTTWPTYTGSVLRLAPSTDGPITVQSATSYSGSLQPLPSDYRTKGCGWQNSFTIDVGTDWTSGIYSARLASTAGTRFDVMFVVKPTTPQNKIAFIVPTNTYNAYNYWGGHNQYTIGQAGGTRTFTFLRPSTSTTVEPSGIIDHQLYSDLQLCKWMTANSIQADFYTDGDLLNPALLSPYKAVVLGSHPEYWTAAARTNLLAYINGGGRVICTGGNAVHEEVSYTPDYNAVVYRDQRGSRYLFGDRGYFLSEVLGVIFNGSSYMDFHPYQVQNNHPFLAGTGLKIGDRFGFSGLNGAASGWEVDWAARNLKGLTVLAEGTNPFGGASLTYQSRAKGGWVFTSGSIAFNGAIAGDHTIQKILSNAFAAAAL